jgi:hypothetical protein
MATDSAIGYAAGTIDAFVPPTYSDSLIGYAAGTTDSYVPPTAGARDSLIGYAYAVIDSYVPPSTGSIDSLIGFAAGTIDDPAVPDTTSSLVGYAVGTIDEPGSGPRDSLLGFAADTLRNPAYPIGVFDGTKIRYVPALIFTDIGSAMPTGPVNQDGHTFTPVVAQDFITNAALGQVRSAYPSMGYYNGFHDTSGYGTYDPDGTMSVNNSVLTVTMRTAVPSAFAQVGGATADPQPLVAAFAPDNYTAIKYGRIAVRYRTRATGAGYKFVGMFWPKSDIWNEGEIDFVEADLGKFSRPANATPGTYQNGGMLFKPDTEHFAPTDTTEFHIGHVNWTPEGIFFYWDGVLLATVIRGVSRSGADVTAVPSTDMRATMQAETFIGEGPVPAGSVGTLEIDWVVSYRMTA